jgi:hypothetical protein
MQRFLLTLTAAATVLATSALVPSRVEASPMAANLPIEALTPIENVAFCFYADGWNGPGLYECGFERRQGRGWHGPRGEDERVGGAMDRDHRGDRSEGRGPQTDGRGPQTEGRGRH